MERLGSSLAPPRTAGSWDAKAQLPGASLPAEGRGHRTPRPTAWTIVAAGNVRGPRPLTTSTPCKGDPIRAGGMRGSSIEPPLQGVDIRWGAGSEGGALGFDGRRPSGGGEPALCVATASGYARRHCITDLDHNATTAGEAETDVAAVQTSVAVLRG